MLQLSEDDIRTLHEALDSEYRYFETHEQVLRDFGAVPQLVRIRDVEATHINVLRWLHTRYDVPPPSNRWHGHVTRFRNVARACLTVTELELERARMYRRLIATAREPEILGELRNLERASKYGHLPALRAWAKQVKPHRRSVAHAQALTAE